ncbi:MAG: M56 family metallopeptidase, partial [Planctomycetota bacterium]
MDALTAFLSEQTIERIGWVLVHFLWQGVAVGALLWCVLKVLGRASANARYIAACAGLVLVAAAPVATFVIIAPDAPVVMTEASAPLPVSVAADAAPAPVVTRTIVVAPAESVTLPAPSLMETLSAKLEAALPYCVVGWAVGVAVLSVWYLGGWCQLQKLRRIGTKAVSEAVKANASSLWQRLGLRRAVCIVESALVQVPTVIGWLKPVILLPAAALTGLDEVQLTAMIAHELAHIKRCDYLINIAQTIVEILGF